MLLTKTVKVKWSPSNTEHYKKLGYTYVYRGELEILVKHLIEDSHAKVLVKCDYCGKTFSKEYRRLLKSRKEISKDSCQECNSLKKKDILQYRQENGLLNITDNGYWTFRENRLKELDLYIKKHEIIENTNDKVFKTIYDNLSKNGETLWQCVKELGYDINTVIKCRKVGMYDDFENLKEKIEWFITNFNRFPTEDDFEYELGVNYMHLSKYGGIYNIKRELSYKDKDDLQDDNKYYNDSIGEYLIAQLLIKNKIPYKRNVIINSKEGKYNCDFVVYPVNHEPIWIEYWGGLKNKKETTVFKDYNKIYRYKLELYKKYNLYLFSIYPNIFENNNDIINYELTNIIKPILKLQYK